MNQRLRDLYCNVSVHATADLEHQAVIELLLLVMVADRHISSDEIDAIRGDQRRTAAGSRRRSRSTSTSGRRWPRSAPPSRPARSTTLLDDIDGRVASTVLRQSLFSAAREVADVDHELDAEEESLLGQLAARFA